MHSGLPLRAENPARGEAFRCWHNSQRSGAVRGKNCVIKRRSGEAFKWHLCLCLISRKIGGRFSQGFRVTIQLCDWRRAPSPPADPVIMQKESECKSLNNRVRIQLHNGVKIMEKLFFSLSRGNCALNIFIPPVSTANDEVAFLLLDVNYQLPRSVHKWLS